MSAMDRIDGIARWLADRAPHENVKELFAAFCREIVQSGLPVWRASLGLEVLHPEVSGWQHVWMDESVSFRESDRATAASSPSYLNSPTRIVDETARPFRRRLDVSCSDMPLLDELRLSGATDYVMFPLPFLDQTRTAAISFATRDLQGFDQPDIDSLERAARVLSPYLERHVLRRIAIDLLDTYVGPRTGQRIIEGRVDRGAVEFIEAAIWFTDLRGFTRLSERMPIPDVLANLNIWFGIIGEVVEAHGGEVLKFIGDAVLAIFPTSPEQNGMAACRNALGAAREFCRRTDAENELRASQGSLLLRHSLSLHFGEVAYGNVGASHRLDFTVIGPAVNRASRLLDLAKQLDRKVILSRAFARELAQPLTNLGRHRLRGIDHPQQVFTLPEEGLSFVLNTEDFPVADWNAGQYLKFEDERTRPAGDLLRRVPLADAPTCVDIGCGPGNSTELIANRYPGARILGLDNSPDMLAKARARLPALSFGEADIANWQPSERFDLIFANAVLQWLPDHPALLKRLCSFLKPGGCLAVQMPNNLSEPSHRLMRQVAKDGPWAGKLSSASLAREAIGSFDDYYGWLLQADCSADIWQTTYVHPLAGADAIVEWLKSTGLRPYLDALAPEERSDYLQRYQAEIAKAYPAQQDGKVLLRFPRLFMVARRNGSAQE